MGTDDRTTPCLHPLTFMMDIIRRFGHNTTRLSEIKFHFYREINKSLY